MRDAGPPRSPRPAGWGRSCAGPDTKLGPAPSPTAADEHGEADGVEDPERRLGDPAEGRADRAQPAEHEPHDEGAAAGGEAQRQVSDAQGERAEEAAQQDAQAHEHDVGLARGALHVPDRPPGPLDVGARRRPARSRSPRLRTVPARRGSPRRRGPASAERRRGRAPSRPRRAVRSATSLLRDDHVEGGHGEVEELPVLDLLAERRARSQEDVPSRRDDHDVPGLEDGPPAAASSSSAAAADPLDEDARGCEGALDLRHRCARRGASLMRKARTSHSR